MLGTNDPDEGSQGDIDHIVPRARGRATGWENGVLVRQQVNSHGSAAREVFFVA